MWVPAHAFSKWRQTAPTHAFLHCSQMQHDPSLLDRAIMIVCIRESLTFCIWGITPGEFRKMQLLNLVCFGISSLGEIPRLKCFYLCFEGDYYCSRENVSTCTTHWYYVGFATRITNHCCTPSPHADAFWKDCHYKRSKFSCCDNVFKSHLLQSHLLEGQTSIGICSR